MPPISTIYYTLAVLGGIALLLLIVILVRVISMLGKVDGMLTDAQEAIESVHNFVAKPMQIVLQVVEQITSIVGFFSQKNSRSKKE